MFDAKGNGFRFGKYGMKALQKKLLRTYSIQSSIDQKTNGPFEYNHKRRQNMRKAMKRVFCKLKNQVRYAYHRISKLLCESYDAVLHEQRDVTNREEKDSERKSKKILT